ncbi:NAD-dependent epimerase/dehydratase family protein [Anaerovorax sp. IOR16]|uniref:NAD-dependent epimerase/dehydratase family protein n=1 Tax=Anaerovorax sp. IOR16 TaxID=2773458 RepID=UPI0019D24A47|nr:NAD-dependent epimerase/dehydratase family protein [Anaerovorax sp. IOR16]
MKHVLIVGATSYIATAFEKYIDTKFIKVKKISVKDNQWYQMDFSNYNIILFCAAIVHKNESQYTEKEYIKINCELPVAIAKKAKAEGVSQFVFLSTMAVYGLEGKVGETIYINKKTPLHPKSYYGKSKYRAESSLLRERTDYFTVTIVRPPMVYGKDCPGNYQKLKQLVLKYKVFPDIRNQRSMISIDNLCKELKEIINERKSGIFHPQDPEYVCTLDLAKKIALEAGVTLHVSKLLSIAVLLSTPFIRTVHKVWGGLVYDREIDLIL